MSPLKEVYTLRSNAPHPRFAALATYFQLSQLSPWSTAIAAEGLLYRKVFKVHRSLWGAVRQETL